jgi:transposase-like protein
MSSEEVEDVVSCPFCASEYVKVLGSTAAGTKVYKCGGCDKVFIVLKVKSYTVDVVVDEI